MDKKPVSWFLKGDAYTVRAAQAVLRFGPGAMTDFPAQTLVTAAPEYWKKITPIHDERFARALGVDYFAVPEHITYERFPVWYLCPVCAHSSRSQSGLPHIENTQRQRISRRIRIWYTTSAALRAIRTSSPPAL